MNKNSVIIVIFLLFTVSAFSNEIENNKKEIEVYTRKIEENPNRAWSYNIRGNFYFKNKEYDKAVSDYLLAIERMKYYLFYSDLSKAYLAKGEVDKAINANGTAIKLGDSLYNLILIRALCNDLIGEVDKAINDYTIYLGKKNIDIEEKNDFNLAMIRNAILNYTKGNFKDAFRNIDRAIHSGKKFNCDMSEDVFYISFLINLKLKKYEKAYDDLTIVLKSGFNDVKQINIDINSESQENKEKILAIVKKNINKGEPIKKNQYYDMKYVVNKFLKIS